MAGNVGRDKGELKMGKINIIKIIIMVLLGVITGIALIAVYEL